MNIRKITALGAAPPDAEPVNKRKKAAAAGKTILILVLAAIAAQAFVFTAPVSGAEITGAATLGITKKFQAPTPGTGSLFGKTPVRIYTPEYAPIAEGLTDSDGAFSIETAGMGDRAWLLVEVGTATTMLKGYSTDKETVVNPITDTMLTAILKLDTPPGNFTAREIEHISTALIDRAAETRVKSAKNAPDAVEALLSNEAYRQAAGNLASSYSSPGDTVEQVEELCKEITRYVPGFMTSVLSSKAYDLAGGSIISEETLFEIENRFLIPAAFAEWVKQSKIHSANDITDLEINCLRARVENDSAEVETVERFVTASREAGEPQRSTENIVYELDRTKDAKWQLRKRRSKSCSPEQALVWADGSSHAWLGISPCISKYVSEKGPGGERVELKSIYFARNDRSVFWRMEFDSNLFEAADTAGAAARSREPRHVLFIMALTDNVDKEPVASVFSIVAMKDGIPYSMNQIKRIAPDGYPETMTVLNDNFFIAPNYAEGTISLEDMQAVGNPVYANARILLIAEGDKTGNLAKGVPVKVHLPGLDREE